MPSSYTDKVKIAQIPGEVGFTDTYHLDAVICIPAAYADMVTKIDGQYRINGVTCVSSK